MPNPALSTAQMQYLRQGTFTPLTRFRVLREVGGVNHVAYLKDVEDWSLTYDKSMGAATLSLTLPNPDGRYIPSRVNEWNTVWGQHKPLFQCGNRVEVDLGLLFPDGSEKWWGKGPFYMEMPQFWQEAGFSWVSINARDTMRELLSDVFTGTYEPNKISVSGEALTANENRTIYTAAHTNICKVPTPIIYVSGKRVSDGYQIDYAAGKVYFSAAQDPGATVTMNYSYYDMNTNKLGTVIQAICQDAGIASVTLNFTTSGGTTLEPTVGFTQWKYEDNKTHFDCLRELLQRYMPPNFMLRQKDGQVWGGYVYQDTAMSEIVPKRRVDWTQTDEDVYTRCVARGRKADLPNKCIGASITNLYTSGYRIIEGGVAKIIDDKASTQCRYVWNGMPAVPADMFKITLPETIDLGMIQILIGDVEGRACSIKGSLWISEDGATWNIPSEAARFWEGSSSQWLTFEDFDRDYRAKHIKIAMEEAGVGYDWFGIAYGEFPIREVRVYEDDLIYGISTLWNTVTEAKTIPSVSPYKVTLTNPGVIPHKRLRPSIPGFTYTSGTPAAGEFTIEYGDTSLPTSLVFNSANAGLNIQVTYHYITDSAKYDLLLKLGPRTYVMAENAKLSTEQAVADDATSLLNNVWSLYDTAEIDVFWCPWVDVGETHKLRSELLAINQDYLITGLSFNKDGAKISVANYRG